MDREPHEWFVQVEMDATGTAVRTSVRAERQLVMCLGSRCNSEEAAQWVDDCLVAARTGDAFECVVVSPAANAELSYVGAPAVVKIWLVKALFQTARVTRQAHEADVTSASPCWPIPALSRVRVVDLDDEQS